MDSEVRRAKQHERQRVGSVFDRVEQVGREARAGDAAKREQQSPTTKADDDQRRERARLSQ